MRILTEEDLSCSRTCLRRDVLAISRKRSDSDTIRISLYCLTKGKSDVPRAHADGSLSLSSPAPGCAAGLVGPRGPTDSCRWGSVEANLAISLQKKLDTPNTQQVVYVAYSPYFLLQQYPLSAGKEIAKRNKRLLDYL